MTHRPSENDVQRLRRLVSQWRRAKAFAEDPSPESRMDVLCLLDRIVEALARHACEYLGLKIQKAKTGPEGYPEVMRSLTDRLPGLATHKRGMDALHRARNATHHQQSVPSKEDLAHHLDMCERFLDAALQAVWRVSAKQLSRGESLSDPELQKANERAEKAMELGDFPEAMREAAALFDRAVTRMAMMLWSQGATGYLLRTMGRAVRDTARRLSDQHTSADVFDAIEEFAYELGNEIIEKVWGSDSRNPMVPYELARIGMGLHETGEFLALVPPWSFSFDTDNPFAYEFILVPPPGWSPTQEEARSAVDHACKTASLVLRWEKRFPRLYQADFDQS